jgi:hypothetical protein
MRNSNPFKPDDPFDTCNVCWKSGVTLTKDHVPPSGAIGGRRPMKVRQPLEELRLDRNPNAPPHILSKTGLNFPTVCTDCHRKSSTDDERLKDFVAAAATALAGPTSGTGAVAVRAPSGAIVRSILFHNLTSRFASDGNKFEEAIRRVVLGDASAGRNLYLYIWEYGGAEVFIMHDFLALPWFKHLGSILSFPPLTFFVCETALPGIRGINVEDAFVNPQPHIIIDRHANLSLFWPRDSGAVMGGARFAEQIVAETI